MAEEYGLKLREYDLRRLEKLRALILPVTSRRGGSYSSGTLQRPGPVDERPMVSARGGFLKAAAVLAGAAALGMAGCSFTGLDDERISVVNVSDQILLFQIWDLESSHLVDPSPVITPSPGDPRVLEPWESRRLDTEDISGDYLPGRDVRIFLYRVAGSQAEYEGLLTVTAQALATADFRIEIGGG